MEMTIVNHYDNSFSFAELKKDKIKFSRNVNFSKNTTKEAMSISKVEAARIIGKPELEGKKSVPFKDAIVRCPTLKEL